MPIVVDLSLLAVAAGALVLLKMVGGSMPWGHLLIAVGPDGRPMRPRVRWQLWSISQGEPPIRAVVAGLGSCALGVASLVATEPHLINALVHPIPALFLVLLAIIVSLAALLVPMGVIVLMRGILDSLSRRSLMNGRVVGMRRDVGLFGHTYHIAVQAGDRALAKDMWAESFRIDRSTFEFLKPGDRLTLEYSPRLRHVYRADTSEDRAAIR